MISSQDSIERVAGRIEQAYCRKHSGWSPVGLTPGVWATAAFRLLEAVDEDHETPIDPEMFVAVQKSRGLHLDPWAELTQHRSLDNYQKAIRRVVALLRRELEAEIRLGERRLLRGTSLEQFVAADITRISPLARYILAQRAGRPDLCWRLHPAVLNQDRSCPLYRLASRSLLPDTLYPRSSEASFGDVESIRSVAFSLN